MASLTEAFSRGISPYQQTQIFSEKELLQLGYKPVRPENQKQQELYEKLIGTVETIKEFVWGRFKLVGIDNQGKIPPFFVHLKENNAYYRAPSTSDHPECFKFNDHYINNPEVVCHEFTHGIIQYLNPLGNQGEGGAINESIADVVGIVLKRSRYMKDDWKVGELRDLSEPFTITGVRETEQKYDQDGKTTNDNGNVHFNSCFLSHAFYVASTDLEKNNADPGNTQLLKIWLQALKELGDDKKTFLGFSKKTIKVGYRDGAVSIIGDVIRNAWNKVLSEKVK